MILKIEQNKTEKDFTLQECARMTNFTGITDLNILNKGDNKLTKVTQFSNNVRPPDKKPYSLKIGVGQILKI